MNSTILQEEVQQFINDHLKTDITKLILKGSPFEGISAQELANQILAKQKSEKKIPTWFSTKNIYYPPKISIEQTSSEITANYKASLFSGDKIIDITGGFGIDSFYFSKHFKQVFYCEINPELATIVTHNYKQLQVDNVTISATDGIEFLKNSTLFFDCIYIDPSRRNDIKGKVFLLKDCLPNVPENIDFLFSKTAVIILKNSPILDITSAIKELKFVKTIHIIALKNEVKEVLFVLEKNYENTIEIKTINILKEGTQNFNFSLSEKVHSAYSEPLTYLYEPNAAILKSGGFHQITNTFDVYKLHEHSHLYTSNSLINFPGRVFKIQEVLPYDKKKILKLLPDQKANITTRNFPKNVAQIKKETKIKDGGAYYLFFTTNMQNKTICVVCKKV